MERSRCDRHATEISGFKSQDDKKWRIQDFNGWLSGGMIERSHIPW
jgi:hypothetical protein